MGYAHSYERDPVISATGTRADVASGRMAKWQRFNRNEDLLWIDTPSGTVALTRRQVTVMKAIYRLADTGIRVTMRGLSKHLGLSPSTISRTATKLASFGLIAYQSNRGRYGGTVWVLRQAHDTLGWFQDAAKAKVRAWRLAAERRLSRLISNVASYYPGRESELVSTHSSIGRNIKTGWDPADLRELGIL